MPRRFRFLDSHTLADVAERFYCLHDYELGYEREVNLPKEPARVMGAFMLLENTIYRYDRKGATDISSELAAWLADPKRDTAYRALNVQPMSATTLGELRVTLGRRYVYRHAGDCDHALSVDEVRALRPDEPTHPDDYPQHLFQARHLRKKCSVCALHVASHFTLDDVLAPAQPAYLCAYCFSQLHPDHRAALSPEALEEIRPLYAAPALRTQPTPPQPELAQDDVGALLAQRDFFVARYWHDA